MTDSRSQLADITALIASNPDDPSLQALRDDLLQLISLEEQTLSETVGSEKTSASELRQVVNTSSSVELTVVPSNDVENSDYNAKGSFTPHTASTRSITEAPDISPFQPVVSTRVSSKTSSSQPTMKNQEGSEEAKDDPSNTDQRKKKKKTKMDDQNEMTFELPAHLIPLDSDTPAQKLKKLRTSKALKSKFREKQKEHEAEKKQNDWKSFAKGGKRRTVGGGSSIFSTEEGVNARVGVVSGGGTRKMTELSDKGGKRHKFN